MNWLWWLTLPACAAVIMWMGLRANPIEDIRDFRRRR